MGEARSDGATFGTELRRLRTAAGMSLAELARELGTGKGYLSRLERGLQRPSEPFARACDKALGADGALLELAAGPGAGVCPYPGLTSFRTEDAAWFFGRDRAVADLLGLLADPSTAGHPAIVLGPSGIGKSSLLRAGLARAVLDGGLPARVPGAPDVLYLTPTQRPMTELTTRENTRPLDSYALVIVDQFEELFTLCEDLAEREAFIADVCQRSAAGLPVALGLRADFYGHCLAHPPLLAALQARALPLGPMTTAGLRRAITEPAAAEGLTLEPGLAEVLLRDLGTAPGSGTDPCAAGALPLLSHALRTTWQHRTDGVLTVGGYERAGGIHGAVATTAERAYARLSPAQQEAARRVLLGLVRVGEGTDDTRRRMDRSSLAAEPVVEEFTRARLLTADAEHVEISHEALLHAWPRLRGWIDADRAGLIVRQQLMDAATAWEAENRDDSLLYRGSRLAGADAWAACHPEQTGHLMAAFLSASRHHQQRGARRLHRLVAALAALSLAATAALVFAVFKEREATHERNAATSARLATQADSVRPYDPALSMQLSLAAYRTADTVEARGAVLSSSSGPYATRYLGGGTQTTASGMSSDETVLAAATKDGQITLWNAARPNEHVTFQAGYRPRRASCPTLSNCPLLRPVVTGLAFHPRTVLAVVTETAPLRLWDVRDPWHRGAPVDLPGSTGTTAIAFSADGTRLLTGDAQGYVTLWDATHPQAPARLNRWRGHSGRILDVALSRDGRTAATVGGDRTALVWDLRDTTHQEHPDEPDRHKVPLPRSEFDAVALSPDARTLGVTAYEGTSSPLWLADVTSDGHVGPPKKAGALNATFLQLAFGPDGKTLATATNEREVVLWDVADRRRATTLPQTAPISGIAIAANGTTLAVGTDDGSVHLWQPLPNLTGHKELISRLSASRDHGLLITASMDTTARLWDASGPGTPVPLGRVACRGRPLKSAAFSPDGRTVAVGAYGRGDPHKETPFCLWDISNPRQPELLGGEEGHGLNSIVAMAFSNDGGILATGGNDGRVLLWDVTRPENPSKRNSIGSNAEFEDVISLTFLDGRETIVIGTVSAGAQLWNLSSRSPHRITRLPGPTGAVGDLAVTKSPTTGRTLLAAAGHDRNAYLWDATEVRRPALLHTISGHARPVLRVDFSPDSRRLLTSTGEEGGAVRLWNVDRPQGPTLIATLKGPITEAAFTGRGMIAAVTDDQTVRTWRTDAKTFAAEICRLAGAALSTRERQLYLAPRHGAPCGR
ncbi:helix-turn-helix domain-containing protein [Streptomyces sp. NPDC053069]|uniref:nSTAND1 domain-containing NTPase n=1 Tax=Streptomyces sp. NPDC053069 TaxID=3365695 RepID=UPI0037D2C95D